MIRFSASEGIGYITLDRPDKLNALTTAMLRELHDAVDELGHSDLSVIIVNSSGTHFSAGADLAEWATPDSTLAHDMSRVGVEAFNALASVPIPTVAVITGVAAGGGFELALACDLRIAGESARMGFPETGLANLPAYGGIDRAVALVGASRARELLFTNELVTAERAAQMGLVNRVVKDQALNAEVDHMLSQIVAADRRANALAKALTGGAPVDALLSTFTSQTPESRARKTAFLQARSAAKARKQGASS